jgi:hypothetical protein
VVPGVGFYLGGGGGGSSFPATVVALVSEAPVVAVVEVEGLVVAVVEPMLLVAET